MCDFYFHLFDVAYVSKNGQFMLVYHILYKKT